ncbi:helix-turn-helix domain-containing protein [Halococcus agarilyticus]|uniref:transcriptional regulator n=1 Tax=Halococcus agarilyticus TaxID=1232219 RepID=UPI0006780B33|nr:transcriptional regulator [Halococcus agarilyticus]
MAKYSTGDASGDGESCELCGAHDADLTSATVAGAELDLCPNCLDHGETDDRGGSKPSGGRDADQDRDRRQRAAKNTATFTDTGGDSSRWEREGTNYDRDQLPYLVSDYGDRAKRAREDADLSVEALADDLDAPIEELRAVEEGRAARADVGGSLVSALEERLDVTLVEE